ncbi:glycosyltransferase family 2 protein [Campylobacter sp. W0018]|uniref:glycosyltransferase family 2 protein n=1 Tax=Campylobacter sp. W0018 TaxID=2735782 RepID=UPI00301C096D|nr:glycosyltransferase family 2 protein [Campylobacter sp. W0018]
MPKISIILPTYNVEPYIERALQSCINQTFKDIEIIVVDDCGNDKSIDIAKEYAKKDERIKIVHNKENLGLLRARYEGVKANNSFYIMFLDPDDYLELNACEECVKILDSDNNVDLICFNYYEMSIQKRDEYLFYVNAFYGNIEQFYYYLFSQYPSFSWNIFNKVFKKDIYIQTFDLLKLDIADKNTMAEDFLVTLYSLALINRIYTIKHCLYNYNTTNINSATREKKNLQKIQSYKNDLNFVIKKIFDLIYHVNDYYYLIVLNISIGGLNIHKIDLTYKYLTKNFLKKFALKIKRKIVKIKMKKYTKLAKNILKEKNVSSSL